MRNLLLVTTIVILTIFATNLYFKSTSTSFYNISGKELVIFLGNNSTAACIEYKDFLFDKFKEDAYYCK